MMDTGIDCRAVVAAAPDAMIASDASGRITLWNPGAERIFGWTAEEALGQTLDMITPERQRKRHWEGYERSMATGQTKYGTSLLRVPALSKDGRSLSIAFTIAMLFTDDHKVGQVVAIIRDETQRWQDERALKARIAELEAQLASAQGDKT